MPPVERPITARLVRMEDVDRGVKNWFDKVVAYEVTSPQDQRQKLIVKLGGGERWVAAADRQGIRDRDGRLILPVLHIRRGSFDIGGSAMSTGLGANVPRLQIARLVSDKTSRLANLDSNRPISERRLRDSAVYDIYTIPFPVTGVMTYKVIVQAQYSHQMNEIIEKIMSKLEFFDVPSFVIGLSPGTDRPQSIPTGKGSTEGVPTDHAPFDQRLPLTDYYVVGYLDGNLGDDGNLDEFTDQERIIQLQFGFQVPVALMLDPEGERPAVQKETTAFAVRMGDEQIIAVDSRDDLDKIFGPK